MITQALLTVVFAAARGVVGLLPSWEPPAFITDLPTSAADAGAWTGSLGYWVPLAQAVEVITVVFGLVSIVIGARLALWLWSKLPWIGK